MENVFFVADIGKLKELGKIDVAVIIEKTPFFNLLKRDFLIFCLEDHLSFLDIGNKTLIKYIVNYIKSIKVTTQEELDILILSHLRSTRIYEKCYYIPSETKDSLDLLECSYPSNILEVYAYYTQSIIYLEGNKNGTIVITNNPLPSSTRVYLSKAIFNKSFKVDYKYTDKLLSIISQIDQTGMFCFGAPHKDWKMVSHKEVMDALVEIVRGLFYSHPKKIGKYYDLKDTTIINGRNQECTLYKKYVMTGGREVKIYPSVNSGYIKGKNYGVEIGLLFNFVGIYPETSWERAVSILSTTTLRQFYGLINRRCRKKLSDIEVKRRLLYELERYIKPDLVKIVLFGYNRYDLSSILSQISPHSETYNKIRSSHLDEKQYVFVFSVFKVGDIITNYQEWLKEVYEVSPQNEISKYMVSREKLLPLSAKNIQQIMSSA